MKIFKQKLPEAIRRKWIFSLHLRKKSTPNDLIPLLRAWACPEKTYLFVAQPVLSIYVRLEKINSNVRICELDRNKRCKMEEIMLRLSEFSHNPLPSGLIMLAKFFQRGISDPHIYWYHSQKEVQYGSLDLLGDLVTRRLYRGHGGQF